jgi:hypothetical protein
MTAATLTAESPGGRGPAPWPRLAAAELLKLRKRRGLVAAALLLGIAPMLIAYTVLVLLHATNPEEHAPAGGLENLGDSITVFSQLLVVVASLVGVTAGAADVRAGVFRELVVTGRSRLALFAARIPGGLAFLVVPIGVGFAIAATASAVLAETGEAPSAALLATTTGWVVLAAAANFALALGVGSLVGSSSTAIAILLGWNFAVIPVLRVIQDLADFRDALLPIALERLQPEALHAQVRTDSSLTVAIAGIAAWTLIPLVLGAWRTATRDA